MASQEILSKLNAAKVQTSVRKAVGIVGTVDHMDAMSRARLVREAEKKANDASERARLVRKAETQASALCPCERRTPAF